MKQLEGQISMFDPDMPFGKTFPARSAVTEERTTKLSFKPSQKSQTPMFQFLYLTEASGSRQDASWEKATALRGVSTMLSTGECPSVARESTLSQILVQNAPEKYFLSRKACEGILRRAERRGKDLPPMLRDALMEVVAQ